MKNLLNKDRQQNHVQKNKDNFLMYNPVNSHDFNNLHVANRYLKDCIEKQSFRLTY